jgi:hypothetical protein
MLDELERRRIAQGKADGAAAARAGPGAPAPAAPAASASPAADAAAEDFRAVAPPVMSFASGRRR